MNSIGNFPERRPGLKDGRAILSRDVGLKVLQRPSLERGLLEILFIFLKIILLNHLQITTAILSIQNFVKFTRAVNPTENLCATASYY